MEPDYPNPEGNGQQRASSRSGPQDKAADLARQTREAARSRATAEAEQGMQAASRMAGDSAEALDRAAETLDRQGQKTLAQTTASIASGLSEFSRRLEERSVDELVHDIADLARRNPEMFILGGIGAGFVLSRFFKASASGPAGTSASLYSASGSHRASDSFSSSGTPDSPSPSRH